MLESQDLGTPGNLTKPGHYNTVSGTELSHIKCLQQAWTPEPAREPASQGWPEHPTGCKVKSLFMDGHYLIIIYAPISVKHIYRTRGFVYLDKSLPVGLGISN